MQVFRKNQEPAVHKLKEPILDEITDALRRRYELNFTRQDTSSLWYLCKQEASLLNVTDQACDLFTPSEISSLEWTDDLELFTLKGYGNALNYQMGVPLLEDVVQSMEQAIKAKEEGLAPGTYEKARMRFAHAETLLPFSCLLGLFLEGSDFERIQKEQPLELPPKPPQRRNWRGSEVAPFAGNNMLVLYSCPDNSSSKYFVQVLHNERPVPMPGCDNSDVCPYEVFKERIVAPHLKHNYNTLCNLKSEEPEQMSLTSKLSEMLRSQRSNDPQSTKLLALLHFLSSPQLLQLVHLQSDPKVPAVGHLTRSAHWNASDAPTPSSGMLSNLVPEVWNAIGHRYDVAKDIPGNWTLPSSIPDTCTPIHLNLVVILRFNFKLPMPMPRFGLSDNVLRLCYHRLRFQYPGEAWNSCSYQEKVKRLNDLATRIEVLLQDTKEQKLATQKVPAWFWGWKSPWKGKLAGGELIKEGEEELFNLGIRTRDKFPQLFNEDYHPDVYLIKATEVGHSFSPFIHIYMHKAGHLMLAAVAFGMGLFSGRGNLGPGCDRAFAVSSESCATDIMLRFHDCCHNYKTTYYLSLSLLYPEPTADKLQAFLKKQEPTVDKLKEPILDEITDKLRRRYELNFTRQDIYSLWYLCKQEASLLNKTDQACALFTPSEVSLLEWTDDLQLFMLEGYGNALNYRMGVPLLQDVVQSMEQAIKAKE
ncbi:hypothetical protein C3L33_02925, partial [Rhododendron williamsianum]